MDEIISHVAWIDEHRPAAASLWILAENIATFRDYAEWAETIQKEEWAPVEDEA